jgi:hypothetical protein
MHQPTGLRSKKRKKEKEQRRKRNKEEKCELLPEI